MTRCEQYHTLSLVAFGQWKSGNLEAAKRTHIQALILREKAYSVLPGGFRVSS